MDPRVKTFGLLAVVALVASYFLAAIGVGDGTAMTVWYVLMSIATGLAGVGFAIGTVVVAFGWDE